jgi:hypothetical protein
MKYLPVYLKGMTLTIDRINSIFSETSGYKDSTLKRDFTNRLGYTVDLLLEYD